MDLRFAKWEVRTSGRHIIKRWEREQDTEVADEAREHIADNT